MHFSSKYTSSIESRLTFVDNKDTDIYDIVLVKNIQDSLFFTDETIEYKDQRYELEGGGQVERIKFVMLPFCDFSLEPQVVNSDYIKLRWFGVGNNDYSFGAKHLSDGSIRFVALATFFFATAGIITECYYCR